MRIFTFLLLLLLTSNTYSQQPILDSPKVDERVELLSIAFRLAEAREYSANRFPLYVKSIEEHFKDYKEHALIKYIKKLRNNGIGYDAVMYMALSITEPPHMTPIVPFSKEIPESRWGEKRATTFLKHLNDFYKDAHCEAFFKAQQSLYTEASRRFKKVYKNLDISWYKDFYGAQPKGEFNIINGLGNGGGNYGPTITRDGKEIAYAVMGMWSVDEEGMPLYEADSYFPTMLHEFNHSFVNHVVEKYHSQLARSGKKVFKALKERMSRQAYGNWKTVYSEAIVRASVIKYLKDHNYDPSFITQELNDELNRGFVWTEDLVNLLESYDTQRAEYPTLESFMPEIIRFFDQVAENLPTYINTIENKRPKLIQILPFENGSKKVDASTKTIQLIFDRPIITEGVRIYAGDKGEDAFPAHQLSFSEDKTKALVAVELIPGKRYQFILHGYYFKTSEGFGLNTEEIVFKTKK